MIKDLNDIFVKILKLDSEENIEELDSSNIDKWDSLNHIHLIISIEKKFQISFDNGIIPNLTTYKKIKKYLLHKNVI